MQPTREERLEAMLRRLAPYVAAESPSMVGEIRDLLEEEVENPSLRGVDSALALLSGDRVRNFLQKHAPRG